MDTDAFTRPVSSASLASLSSSSSTTDETDELKDAPQAKQQQPRITVQGSDIFTTNVFPLSPGKDWNQDAADAYEQEQELDRSFMEDDDEYVTAPFDIPYEPPPPRSDIFPSYYEEDSPELYYQPDESIEVDVETFQDEDQDMSAPPTSHLLTHVAFLARQNEFLRAELSHARENIHAMRRVVETMDMERIAEREKLVERAEQERMKRNEWIADIFKNGTVCQTCSTTDSKARIRSASAESRERERSSSVEGKPIERPGLLHDMSPYHSPLQSKSSQEYVAGWAAELALMEENSKERSRNYDDYDTPAVPYNSDAEEVYEDDDAISELDLASDVASPMPKEGGLARMLWLTANGDSDSNSSDDEEEHVFNFASTKSCEDARICLTPCQDGDRDGDVVIFPKKVFSFSTWGGEGDEIYAGSSDDDAEVSIVDESFTDNYRIDEEELEVY